MPLLESFRAGSRGALFIGSHLGNLEVLRAFLAERRSRERTIDPGAQSLAWLHAAYRSFSSKRFEIA